MSPSTVNYNRKLSVAAVDGAAQDPRPSYIQYCENSSVKNCLGNSTVRTPTVKDCLGNMDIGAECPGSPVEYIIWTACSMIDLVTPQTWTAWAIFSGRKSIYGPSDNLFLGESPYVDHTVYIFSKKAYIIIDCTVHILYSRSMFGSS